MDYNCDCGVTGGCPKCLQESWHSVPAMLRETEQIQYTQALLTFPTEEMRLLYHRIMALAKAVAQDNAYLCEALVDAVSFLKEPIEFYENTIVR